ncbi:MAG: DUF5343 domain-containing protein [Methanomicrobiales archaeon]|nr:DUF5343 domain-containing protein [Methanomicrobiales archaeon]
MVQDQKANRTPPYISYSTFRTMVGNLKEHGVPAQMDSSVLGNFSGTVKTQLLTAMRFLDLIEQGGKTGSKLNGLAEAFQTPQWGPTLAAVLRESYKPIVAHDLKTATPHMIDRAFRDEYGAADAVQKKCVTFFLHAAKDAAMGLSTHLSHKTRRPAKRGSQQGSTRKKALIPVSASATAALESLHGVVAPPVRAASSQLVLQLLEPGMDDDVQNAVWILLKYLRKKETSGGAS